MSPLLHKILRDKKDILKHVSFWNLNNGGLRSQYMKQVIHVNELTLYYGILCYVMHLVILYCLL